MNLSVKNKCHFATLFALILIFILTGCATQSRSVGLGGAIGAAGGALLGGIASPGKNGEMRTRNIIVGSAVGGMAGMMTASILHENGEAKTKEAYLEGQKSGAAKSHASYSNAPSLKNPTVESRWVEGRAYGNKYIEGHYEYIIVEPTRWDLGND